MFQYQVPKCKWCYLLACEFFMDVLTLENWALKSRAKHMNF